MNDIIKAMEERRSIRKFKADMPSKDDIDQIIEAGLYAASGRGKQAPIIIAVTNKELRDKLSAANCKIGGWQEGFDPFFGAPVVLIVLADKSAHTYVYDGALTMGNICWPPTLWALAAAGFTEPKKNLKCRNTKNY